MFRQLYRKLLDHEVGVLGVELARTEARLMDAQTQLQSLQIRMTNMVQRVSMRINRLGGGTDAEVMRDAIANARGRQRPQYAEQWDDGRDWDRG